MSSYLFTIKQHHHLVSSIVPKAENNALEQHFDMKSAPKLPKPRVFPPYEALFNSNPLALASRSANTGCWTVNTATPSPEKLTRRSRLRSRRAVNLAKRSICVVRSGLEGLFLSLKLWRIYFFLYCETVNAEYVGRISRPKFIG